jgi:Fungal specific transcription factor domain
MATDLNLHRKTAVTSQDTQEGRTRDIEVRNRERTWILCFALDRSFSAQMGKPSSIKEEYVIDVFFFTDY